jgi:hypothetical protein
MALFYYFCDESYDSRSKHPRTYVVAGFVATERTWNKVQKQWKAKNKRVGISEFHASHLNAKDYEFEGWSNQRSKRYTKSLLKILQRQGQKLWVFSVGISGTDYERVISDEGRRKLGSPYIVCFKECVTFIAESMYREGPQNNKFSVIFDSNEFRDEAMNIFYALKENKQWSPHRHLHHCVPSSPSEFVPLQPADLIAYETFKLIHDKHYGAQRVRKAMQKLLPHNGFTGYYWDAEAFKQLKPALEAANCRPNCFMIQHVRDDKGKPVGVTSD